MNPPGNEKKAGGTVNKFVLIINNFFFVFSKFTGQKNLDLLNRGKSCKIILPLYMSKLVSDLWLALGY
jgi:hypothetical protein